MIVKSVCFQRAKVERTCLLEFPGAPQFEEEKSQEMFAV
jgi:hypothetical protein